MPVTMTRPRQFLISSIAAMKASPSGPRIVAASASTPPASASRVRSADAMNGWLSPEVLPAGAFCLAMWCRTVVAKGIPNSPRTGKSGVNASGTRSIGLERVLVIDLKRRVLVFLAQDAIAGDQQVDL